MQVIVGETRAQSVRRSIKQSQPNADLLLRLKGEVVRSGLPRTLPRGRNKVPANLELLYPETVAVAQSLWCFRGSD